MYNAQLHCQLNQPRISHLNHGSVLLVHRDEVHERLHDLSINMNSLQSQSGSISLLNCTLWPSSSSSLYKRTGLDIFQPPSPYGSPLLPVFCYFAPNVFTVMTSDLLAKPPPLYIDFTLSHIAAAWLYAMRIPAVFYLDITCFTLFLFHSLIHHFHEYTVILISNEPFPRIYSENR